MLESPELVSSSCMPEPVAVLPLYVSVTLALHFYPECKIVNHLPKSTEFKGTLRDRPESPELVSSSCMPEPVVELSLFKFLCVSVDVTLFGGAAGIGWPACGVDCLCVCSDICHVPRTASSLLFCRLVEDWPVPICFPCHPSRDTCRFFHA